MGHLRQPDFHAVLDIVQELYSYQTPEECEVGMTRGEPSPAIWRARIAPLAHGRRRNAHRSQRCDEAVGNYS